MKPARSNPNRRPAALALLLIASMTVMACASIGNVTSTIGTAATAAAAIASQSGSAVTPVSGTGGAQSSARCQTIGNAFIDFEGEYPFLAALTSDGAYASNTPDSMAYVNIPKLQGDLDVLATLPNGPVGPIAPAIDQFRALVNQIDSNIKSGGKPFSDGSGDGQKVLDLYLKLAQPYVVVAETFGSACPNYSAAAATPAPAQPSLAIGQTGNVGDLRVTVDKVSQPAIADGLPQPGNRFLIVHVTIANTGKTALQVTALGETNMKDAAGNDYGFDPFANALPSLGAGGGFDGEIPAGGTKVGLVAYQVPTNAGDLTWIFHDYVPNQVTFAIPASSIDTSAASSAPTEQALRDSAAASQTAFFSMAATVEAADLTGTPAP
jgi:Domain of unknown function (DUF4352)